MLCIEFSKLSPDISLSVAIEDMVNIAVCKRYKRACSQLQDSVREQLNYRQCQFKDPITKKTCRLNLTFNNAEANRTNALWHYELKSKGHARLLNKLNTISGNELKNGRTMNVGLAKMRKSACRFLFLKFLIGDT